MLITVADFEKRVMEIENVCIIVRAPANDQVEDYAYKQNAQQSWNVAKWLNSRIKSSVQHEVVVIDGYGKKVHQGTSMATLRSSYNTNE